MDAFDVMMDQGVNKRAKPTLTGVTQKMQQLLELFQNLTKAMSIAAQISGEIVEDLKMLGEEKNENSISEIKS